ncbi:MAG: nicotinamide-nucleotide amidohydrolase family protein [Spirochaetaceae bacterium]|jgi:nicotinamide-nucleotide amidase|nr:nicotinamide-nucleotide amidohydrolase family protein [Spirochaetaceae bacterium]
MTAAAMLVRKLGERGETLALAESCTAGLAAAEIAAIPGASAVLWGAYVTYTAAAKTAMLAVPPALIAEYGTVSAACAGAMASGALEASGAALAAAVTGLAGPGGEPGGQIQARIGDVWFAVCCRGGSPHATLRHFEGSRNQIRAAAAAELLAQALKTLT